jgi:hypothetical protein
MPDGVYIGGETPATAKSKIGANAAGVTVDKDLIVLTTGKGVVIPDETGALWRIKVSLNGTVSAVSTGDLGSGTGVVTGGTVVTKTGNPLLLDFTAGGTGFEVNTAGGWTDGNSPTYLAYDSANAAPINVTSGTYSAPSQSNPITEAQYRSMVYSASDATHSGSMTITLPSRTGEQYVRLHFMNVGSADAFSITANGSNVKSNYIAGGVTTPTLGKADIVEFNVSTTGGNVVIVLTPLNVNAAAVISAVQIYQ